MIINPNKTNRSDESKHIPIEDLPMEQQKERVRTAYMNDGYSSSEAAFIADRWENWK